MCNFEKKLFFLFIDLKFKDFVIGFLKDIYYYVYEKIFDVYVYMFIVFLFC